MNKIVLGLIPLILFTTTASAQFSLTGTTNGIADGTIIYLDNTLTDEELDSIVVQNNTFTFTTKIENTPFRAILYTIDFSYFKILWLEDKPMTLVQGEKSFKDSTISGSASEDLRQKFKKETKLLEREELLLKEIEFIKANSNSIVSANILNVYKTFWGREKVIELFDLLNPELKASTYGKRINKYINLNKAPKIGEKYIDLAINDINNKNTKLSDVKGKVTLLEFWASWCRACRVENPELVKTYEAYHPKGFEIYAVSLDSNKERWIKAIEKDNLNWTHVSDLEGKDGDATLLYGVSGIPDNFLIDENGKIVARNISGEKLKVKLMELLD